MDVISIFQDFLKLSKQVDISTENVNKGSLYCLSHQVKVTITLRIYFFVAPGFKREQ